MGHVTQLCRKATELVSRKVEVNEAGELGNIWGDALWREGWRGSDRGRGVSRQDGGRGRGRGRGGSRQKEGGIKGGKE